MKPAPRRFAYLRIFPAVPRDRLWYHHTDADTIDTLDPDEVARCVATLAVMAYVVADMRQTLPR